MQDGLSGLRSQYDRIVTPAAMAAYKQVATGSTSDKDIDTALTGVPKDNADAGTMASFLRGLGKLQVYNSVLKTAEADWQGQVKHLGKAPTDIDVDGVRVPKGTQFQDYVKDFVLPKVDQQVSALTVQGRGYMAWANPQPQASQGAPATMPSQAPAASPASSAPVDQATAAAEAADAAQDRVARAQAALQHFGQRQVATNPRGFAAAQAELQAARAAANDAASRYQALVPTMGAATGRYANP